MDDRILYLECYSGISGDMTVGALLDLGAREEKLREALDALQVGGYTLSMGRTRKCGIGAFDFDVILEDTGLEGHGHRHEHCLEGHEHHHEGHDQEGHVHEEHGHEHSHGEHEHSHGHSHEEHEHHHSHEHRSYRDICEILERAPLDPKVRCLAEKMFLLVARAEAKVHEKSLEEVHFHEVGAVDSIVDIVGAAACFVDLGIEEVYVSSLYEGMGNVWCQHGRIPVPAPAVTEIAAAAGLPMRITDTMGEMVTPTGAAIAAALRTMEKLPDMFTIEKIGIGAGKKEFAHANVLRAMILRKGKGGQAEHVHMHGEHSHGEPAHVHGEHGYEEPGHVHEEHVHGEPEHVHEEAAAEKSAYGDEICVLETNIDDCSGEQLAYAIERLMKAGARDASCFPIFMKKNRPAWMLQVLCREDKVSLMEDVIFKETTSIGMRKYKEKREILPRSIEHIQTELGEADIKICTHKGQRFYYPEYASIHQICEATGKSYREIYEYLSQEAKKAVQNEEQAVKDFAGKCLADNKENDEK